MPGIFRQLMRNADMQTTFTSFLYAGHSSLDGSTGVIALGGSILAIPEDMMGRVRNTVSTFVHCHSYHSGALS